MFIFRPKLKLIALALTGGFLAGLGAYQLEQNDRLGQSNFPICSQVEEKGLPDISFKGLHSVENQIAYGDISLTNGPNRKNSVPVNVNQITCSPLQDSCYGIIGHQLVKLDPKSDWQTTPIQLPSEVPELSWPTGITFNIHDNSLLVSSLGGKGYLYSYSFKGNHWQAFSLNDVDLTSIVYHPYDRQLYALKVIYGEGTGIVLYRLSLTGQILEATRLSDSIVADLPRFHESHLKPQLISSGKYLILVSRQERVFPNRSRNTSSKSRIYTIDPETKQVEWRWEEPN